MVTKNDDMDPTQMARIAIAANEKNVAHRFHCIRPHFWLEGPTKTAVHLVYEPLPATAHHGFSHLGQFNNLAFLFILYRHVNRH